MKLLISSACVFIRITQGRFQGSHHLRNNLSIIDGLIDLPLICAEMIYNLPVYCPLDLVQTYF